MTLQEQIEIQQTLSELFNKEGLLRVCIETTLDYGYNSIDNHLNDMLNTEIENLEYDLGYELPYEMIEQYHEEVCLLALEYDEFLQSLEVETTPGLFDDLYVYNETEYDFYPQMVEDILENIIKKDLVVSE